MCLIVILSILPYITPGFHFYPFLLFHLHLSPYPPLFFSDPSLMMEVYCSSEVALVFPYVPHLLPPLFFYLKWWWHAIILNLGETIKLPAFFSLPSTSYTFCFVVISFYLALPNIPSSSSLLLSYVPSPLHLSLKCCWGHAAVLLLRLGVSWRSASCTVRWGHGGTGWLGWVHSTTSWIGSTT